MFDLLELQQLMIHETSPEYRKQLAVVDTYMTRLGKGFSAAFLDDFWSELCKLSAIERAVSGLPTHTCSFATACQNSSLLTAGRKRRRSPPRPSSK